MLGDPDAIHTVRWANALAKRGLDIFVFGLSSFTHSQFDPKVNVDFISSGKKIKSQNDGSFIKIVYLRAIPHLKNIIKDFNPDILHAHYASSYGLIGALSQFHPFILSVWGSDVFCFPRKSFLHKSILKYNLSKPDVILSTSKYMADETTKYTDKDIIITPFGVDLKMFQSKGKSEKNKGTDIVIGIVKTLEETYGIEYLIKAFYKVKEEIPTINFKLLIVGGGSLELKLKKLVNELNLTEYVVFTGLVSHDEIPNYLNMIDIFVAPSINESFGVAIIEAGACEKPVVVSNAGGLKEIVEDNVTGIIVPQKSVESLTEAIKKLVLNKELRITLGKNGRQRVEKFYNWETNVDQMLTIYKALTKN